MKVFCDNESGLQSRFLCNSTEDEPRICLDGQCIEKEILTENKTTLVIELQDGVEAEDINTTQVLEDLEAITGSRKEGMSLGYETDERGFIVRLVVLFDDEQAANFAASVMNECALSSKQFESQFGTPPTH